MNKTKRKNQRASENVPDPTDNNLNIKRAPSHYEQK